MGKKRKTKKPHHYTRTPQHFQNDPDSDENATNETRSLLSRTPGETDSITDSEPESENSYDSIPVRSSEEDEPSQERDVKAQNSPDNPFELIADFYLIKDPATGCCYYFSKYFLLIILGVLSVWMYYQTGGRATDINWLSWMLIAGGILSNFMVTINTVGGFWEFVAENQIPAPLRHILKPKYATWEILILTICALISAIPLGAAMFAPEADEDINWLDPWLLAGVVSTVLTNGVIHDHPAMIIAENSPISHKKIKQKIEYAIANPAEKKILLEQQKRSLWVAALKQQAIAVLKLAATQIEEGKIEVPQELQGLIKKTEDLKGIEAWLKIIIAGASIPVTKKHNKGYCYQAGALLSLLTGGVLISSGGAGYPGITIIALKKLFAKTSQPLLYSLLAAAAPVLLLYVLMNYFCPGGVKKVYDTGRAFWYREPALATGIRRYPKITSGLNTICAVGAILSPGTSIYLIQKCFAKDPFWKMFEPFFRWCAIIGVPIFSFNNMFSCINDWANSFALFFGGDDNKGHAKILEMIRSLTVALSQMPDAEFEKGFEQFELDEREKLFNMTEQEFDVLWKKHFSAPNPNSTILTTMEDPPDSKSLPEPF